jgi:hypothetical protein
MQDLRLIGVHEDGRHLLLAAEDGSRFRVPLTDELRAAARRERPRQGHLSIDVEGGLRPRDVQALIRGGASADEVAERAGWSVEKVHRYEGPILAERGHVATLAASVRVRGRAREGVAPTLESRIRERLAERGVDPGAAYWDAHRAEHQPWTVVVTFPAGGRERQASWHFELPDRTITALDDEARWLSEDEEGGTPGPVPAPHVPASGRSTRVYDVEAEGGLRATERRDDPGTDPGTGADTGEERQGRGRARAGDTASREEPVDLMTAMRERSAASRAGRRSGRRRNRRSPADVPHREQQPPEDALPLEDIPYSTVTADLPPAAHADPDPEGADGKPEPEAHAEAEALDAEAAAGTDDADDTGTDPQAQVEAEAADEVDAEADADVDSEQAQVDDENSPDPLSDATSDTTEPADGTELEAEQQSAPKKASSTKASSTKPSRKSGRPSVPSWDDIMFGSRPEPD